MKERTARTHSQVECQLRLLDADLTVAELADAIVRLHAFWGANESMVDGWAEENPAMARAVDWPRRRRAHLFALDLCTLGAPIRGRVTVPHTPAPVFSSMGSAEAFGWLYVAEGSTLGGVLIDRHIRDVIRLDVAPLGCFTPYAEGPAPMWRAFGSALEQWGDAAPDRVEAVLHAAAATFDSLREWLAAHDVATSA